MQSALQRAYPTGLPSNQVITQFAMPSENIDAQDSVQLSLIEQGYPYGWGELVALNGAGTYSITEPMCECWLLRLNAQKPSGSTVTLSASIGSWCAMTAIQRIDPAQTLIYADDLFTWTQAATLGRVGSNSFATPTRWTDTIAQWMGPVTGSATSAPVGEWLLKKWVFFSTTWNYTFSMAADATGNLFLDGTSVISGATMTNQAQATIPVTAGWHLITISCINTGSTPNATGVLLSVTDPNGNVIEDGDYSPAIGSQWQTSGFINPTWTAVSTEDSMRYSWWVIPSSQITSSNVQLQVSATGSPNIGGVFWYSVAPWRWDQGGIYDGTAASGTPAQNPPLQTLEVTG